MSRRLLSLLLAVGASPLTGCHATEQREPGASNTSPPCVVRLGSTTLRHAGEVSYLAFSPDGLSLASAGVDGAIRIWGVERGSRLHVLEGHKSRITCVAFSASGDFIASASLDGCVKLWDTESGREIRCLSGHGGGVRSVVIANSGRLLASGGDDRSVRLWDPKTGRELSRLSVTTAVRSLAFSRDGRLLVCVCDQGTVFVWTCPNWVESRQLTEPSAIYAAFREPNTNLVIASGSGQARIIDVRSGESILDRRVHPGRVNAIAGNSGGAIAAAGEDGKICVLSAFESRPEIVGSIAATACLALSEDGRKVASASDGEGMIRLWDVNQKEDLADAKGGHVSEVTCLSIAPDGNALASGSKDKSVRLWNLASGECRLVVRGHEGPVQAVAFSPDGSHLATTAMDKTVRIWSVADGQQISALHYEWPISSLAFTADGNQLLCGGAAGVLYSYEVGSYQEVKSLQAGAAILALGVSRDDQFTAVGTLDSSLNAGLELWQRQTGRLIARIPLEGCQVRSLVFTPDNRTVIAVSGEFVRGWRTATAREVFSVHEPTASALSLSQDGRVLAIGCQRGVVRLVELLTASTIDQIQLHDGRVAAVAFSRRGFMATGGADTTIAILYDQWPRATPDGRKRSDVARLLTELASPDAHVGFAAIREFMSAANSVALLDSCVLAARTIDLSVQQLTLRLDDDDLAIREEASRELQRLGETAEPALCKALDTPCGSEARARMQELLDALDKPTVGDSGALRAHRAIQLLELTNSPEARQLLEKIAATAPTRRERKTAAAAHARCLGK